MAMIDYGALVIRNGQIINKKQFFMSMKDAVGWDDAPPKRYNDCTNTCEDTGESDCAFCHKVITDADGRCKDCHGNELPKYNPNRICGNFFAYVGDEKMTFCFYKCRMVILVGKQFYKEYWCGFDEFVGRKSVHLSANGIDVRVRKVCPGIYWARFVYGGNHYNVIFGYGIDTNPRVWNSVKVRYLGKADSKSVDKLIYRLTKAPFV